MAHWHYRNQCTIEVEVLEYEPVKSSADIPNPDPKLGKVKVAFKGSPELAALKIKSPRWVYAYELIDWSPPESEGAATHRRSPLDEEQDKGPGPGSGNE